MRRKRFLLLVAAGGVLLGACGESADDAGGLSGLDRGRLTIQLTDAPGDLEDAFVKIERIVLIRSERDTSSSGRIEIVPDNTGFIELLALSGGRLLDLVEEEDVPEGSYAQVRIVLDEAYVRLRDGRVFATPGATLPSGVDADGELKCPSCSQSGFKVNFPDGGLVVNGTSIIILDFDASKSFGHEAGKSGKWIMKPTLRATARNIEFARITGSVSLATDVTIPACGGQNNTRAAFRPLATTVMDTITGVTDTTGVYRISNLLPATFTLNYIKDLTFTNGDSLSFVATAAPASVTVAAGDSARSDFQITAATCH